MKFLAILISIVLTANVAHAQGPYGQYEIDGQEWGLFGYYVSNNKRPHFLAVFRPTGEQPSDPEQFDFEAACAAVLASPPQLDGVPQIEPTGAVVFFQSVERWMLVFSTNVSSFTEFDVKEGECLKAEPSSIYTPVPGFTPGISN